MKWWLGLLLGVAPVSGFAITFPVCWDYECGIKRNVEINPDEWRFITQPLAEPALSAPVERQSIRTSIARFEQVVGRLTGTSADLAENAAGAGDPGQMDCIDESSNSQTYLTLLQNHDLLAHHRVKPKIYRNKWIFDVHWTAVIEDTQSQMQYAVDSWFLDNGHPPYIQTLDAWMNKDAFE